MFQRMLWGPKSLCDEMMRYFGARSSRTLSPVFGRWSSQRNRERLKRGATFWVRRPSWTTNPIPSTHWICELQRSQLIKISSKLLETPALIVVYPLGGWHVLLQLEWVTPLIVMVNTSRTRGINYSSEEQAARGVQTLRNKSESSQGEWHSRCNYRQLGWKENTTANVTLEG